MSRSNESPGELIKKILKEEIPFRFLSSVERRHLISGLEPLSLHAGETVLEQGGTGKDVYLLVSGLVETLDTSTDPPIRINRITSGRYFGERACLFDQPRDHTVTAVEDSTLYSLKGEMFLEFVHTSRSFAQSLGSILREKQGIFDAFDTFSAALVRGVSSGSIDIRRLLPLYQQLEPALHPGANVPWIDFDALRYAVSRLPENITRNFVYLLTDDIPYEFTLPDEYFVAVPTAARRRNIWEMLPGKSLVLLRNGMSDLVDFVTCLCLYAVEVRKIRKTISDPGHLMGLNRFLSSNNTLHDDLLKGMPFDERDVGGLKDVWGADVAIRLRQIAFHREALHIDIRRQTMSYNSRRTDIWTRQVGNATLELLGYEPSDLPDDVRVHIVSSNTHSVTNCLNPFLSEYSREILTWARESNHIDASDEWDNPQDLVYAVSRDYLLAHPELAVSRQAEREWGILRLHETVSTGIEVQLIDVRQLAGHAIDPDLDPMPAGTRALLINIDYAFGEQAEEIIRNLILLFGRRLASINVLGKAGSLVGSRGDILIPTAFIEQTDDRFYPFTACVTCDYDGLEESVPRRSVHYGRMLTVAGTLLQNRQMLHFYRHMWGCIGLEMEGTCYYRQILESQQLGVIPSDLQLRFLYYVSDLPLDKKADLASRLSASEGVPPLYGITRQIIRDIFNQERKQI